MQNSAFWIRITSLYGSQLSFLAFARKTVALGPEIQVSTVPSPNLWIFAIKTATLARELQVSVGPSFRLWLLHAKERL